MAQQLISFAKLTGGTETVRCTPLKDGKTYMHVYDFIKVMCKQPQQPGDSLANYKKKAYKNAWTIWHRLDEEKMAEIFFFCAIHNFGRGDADNTPVITLDGASKLINWLPGETLEVYRDKVIDFLKCYLTGMHAELEIFSKPVNILTCETLVGAPVVAGFGGRANEPHVQIPQLIPFAEVTGEEDNVRCTQLINGNTYIHVYDFIKVLCKKKKLQSQDDVEYRNKAYKNAWTIWDRLDKVKKQELAPWCDEHSFVCNGKKTPVITFEGALKLMQWLPGNVAKSIRSRAADILIQHFDNNTKKFLTWTEETAKQAEEEEALREPETKYVYGAVSDAFPGLVKIGFASSLDSRMHNANVFCAPAPFEIVAQAPTLNPIRDERMAHTFFAEQREQGEFFRVSVQAVENFFTTYVLAMYNQESEA